MCAMVLASAFLHLEPDMDCFVPPLTTILSGMAYALLCGVPPVYALYSFTFTLVAYRQAPYYDAYECGVQGGIVHIILLILRQTGPTPSPL